MKKLVEQHKKETSELLKKHAESEQTLTYQVFSRSSEATQSRNELDAMRTRFITTDRELTVSNACLKSLREGIPLVYLA